MNISESQEYFKNLKLNSEQEKVAQKVMKNIMERLEFLEGVGLSYMTLSRRANTLSG
jgi:excinuclease ABC subunit A